MERHHPGARWVRRGAVGFAAIGLVTALSGTPAMADRAIFQDHVKVRHDLHVVPELTAACGFEVLHEERVNLVQRFYEDGREEVRLSVEERLVGPSTGEVLHNRAAGTVTVQGTTTVDGDQLVIDAEAQHVGLPSMWRKDGEGVLLRDAGLAVLDVHVVLDISQDPPALVTEEVEANVVHGPHPELGMSTEEFEEFLCGALS